MEIDDSDNTDLDVGYQASVDQEKEFNSYSSGWGWSAGWRGGGWCGWLDWIHRDHNQSDFDNLGWPTKSGFYDSRRHDLIWRGVASQTIDPYARLEKRQEKLEKAVARLLKNFPPKANGG